jgi:hypothetical protein
VAELLLASEEGLSSMKFVILNIPVGAAKVILNGLNVRLLGCGAV